MLYILYESRGRFQASSAAYYARCKGLDTMLTAALY